VGLYVRASVSPFSTVMSARYMDVFQLNSSELLTFSLTWHRWPARPNVNKICAGTFPLPSLSSPLNSVSHSALSVPSQSPFPFFHFSPIPSSSLSPPIPTAIQLGSRSAVSSPSVSGTKPWREKHFCCICDPKNVSGGIDLGYFCTSPHFPEIR